MDLLAISLVVIGCVLGVGLTLLMLPGIWLMVLVGVGIELWHPDVFSIWTLLAVAGLGLVAEVLELVASARGVRKARGSRAAGFASIVGAVAGAILGSIFLVVPVLGTIVGGILGAGLAAATAEKGLHRRGWGESWRVGRGAAQARAWSVIIKLALAILIGLILVTASMMP